MAGLSPAHLLIILVIALVVIGPGKLPEVGAAIGKSVREFQKASGGITDTLMGTVHQPAPVQQPALVQLPAQPMQPQPPAQSYYAAQPGQPTYGAPAYPQQPVQYGTPAYPQQPVQYGAPVDSTQAAVAEPAAPAPPMPAPATSDTEQHPVG